MLISTQNARFVSLYQRFIRNLRILEIFPLLYLIVSFDDMSYLTNCIHKLCESIAKIICKISLFWRNYNQEMREYQDIRRPEHPTYRGCTVFIKRIYNLDLLTNIHSNWISIQTKIQYIRFSPIDDNIHYNWMSSTIIELGKRNYLFRNS